MDPARIGRILALLVLAGGMAAPNAVGQSLGKRVFSTRANCETAALLSAEECRNAYANASAELDEKSPRFNARAECEKIFSHCMIAGFDRKRIEFEPSLRGFEVSVRSATDKTVVPVVEGDSSSLGFRARTALRPDAGLSNSARQQAQARWAQAQKARAAAEALARMPPEAPIPSAENPNTRLTAAPDAEPPRPPSARDLAAAARRREEFRNAPTVY